MELEDYHIWSPEKVDHHVLQNLNLDYWDRIQVENLVQMLVVLMPKVLKLVPKMDFLDLKKAQTLVQTLVQTLALHLVEMG